MFRIRIWDLIFLTSHEDHMLNKVCQPLTVGWIVEATNVHHNRCLSDCVFIPRRSLVFVVNKEHLNSIFKLEHVIVVLVAVRLLKIVWR